ncbi:MAG TPA: glycosyl hydrolase 115 family protein [Pelobium sp.]|nr:glycosyl hydrolase 115 family protein [Pelobium sp.]
MTYTKQAKNFRTLIMLALFTVNSFSVKAQLKTLADSDKNSEAFALVDKKSTPVIYYDGSDAAVVAQASNLFSKDIEMVSGIKPAVATSEKISGKTAVIIGTLGANKLIAQLIKKGKINVERIRGGWEQFVIQTVDNPFPNVSKALVIVGSDRRGTAYGVFTISKNIGVSPWYWWADVPAVKHKSLFLAPINYASKEPSVKYRGIFINDEDWGLRPWAKKNIDADIKFIGPNTYEKVCELLLRLKANMLAPAMHPGSGTFYKFPENMKTADKYGIIVSTSHTEPLLFNNASEWKHDVNGDWNYLTNKEGVLKVLDKRVSESSAYENAYTMGMRGIHDTGMADVPAGYTKAKVLEDVISDQRDILKKYLKKPIDQIPQLFVPYKEVLDIYEDDMKLADDITLVWPDDNYGYIKRLSDSKEIKRSGGAGVYYHISYLGHPNDYLWLNTTPPALIYEEMYKAYQTNAKRYWLLNVGDIKPGEHGIQFFLDMAWDINHFNYENVPAFEGNFLSSIFGAQYKTELSEIMKEYYQLAFSRKPEAMAWDFRWNSMFTSENIYNTDYSFQNYNEAQGRLDKYNTIATKAEKIMESLPKEYVPAFYELVYYPVKGADLMNKKMLIAQKNRWYALQGRSITNKLGNDVKIYHDSIELITKHYNGLLDGKWDGIMTAPDRLPKPQVVPTTQINLPEQANLGIFVSGEEATDDFSSYHMLPRFNVYTKKSYKIEVYNKGKNSLSWKAESQNNWIKLDKLKGNTSYQDEITVSVDWTKAPIGTAGKGEIIVTGAGQTETVYVSLFNPEVTNLTEIQGAAVEDNGVVSIDPTNFTRKNEKDGVKINVINGLGYEGRSLQLGSISDSVFNSSTVEYDFYTSNAGSATVYIYALPVFPKDKEHTTQYGVTVDNSYMRWMNVATQSQENSFEWKNNVIRNCAINTATISLDKPGKHTFKLTTGDPGMVIQKIVIDLGGMKRSYLGPPTTNYKTK